MIFVSSTMLIANKTSVEVTAPQEVKMGSEITIVVTVTHKGNSKTHHTDWVNLAVNSQTVKRWEFTKKNLPESGSFSLEFKMIVTEDLVIKAEGNCNLHGSKGFAEIHVKST